MGRVLTNATAMAYAVAAAEGTEPTSGWRQIQRNTNGPFGAVVKSEARNPISSQRSREEGAVVDLDAGVQFETDLVLSEFRNFIEAFAYADAVQVGGTGVSSFAAGAMVASVAASKALDLSVAVPVENETVTIGTTVYRWRDTLAQAYDVKIGATISISLDNLVAAVNETGTDGTEYFAGTDVHPDVTAVKTDSDTMTVTANRAGVSGNSIALAETMTNGAWAAGAVALSGGTNGTIVVADDGDLAQRILVYVRGSTNGLNDGLKRLGSGSTTISLKIDDDLVTDAAPPANCTVEVAGVEGAASDFTIDASGDLTSTAFDWTTPDLTRGQSVWIGGVATANKFATAANRGPARVIVIAAGKLTLARRSQTYATDAGTGKTIHVYFGDFVRDVDESDAAYTEKAIWFELAYPNLGTAGAAKYEYAEDCYADAMTVSLPLAAKATMGFTFVGKDAQAPRTTRATGASSALEPNARKMYATATHIARLRLTETDETGLSTYFKSLTLSLKNNTTGEKVLGILGPEFINVGNLEFDYDFELVFTAAEVAEAIRNNTTVTLDGLLRNEDGAMLWDIPAAKLGGGERQFPVNASVLIRGTGMAFRDTSLGFTFGVTIFPYLPAS